MADDQFGRLHVDQIFVESAVTVEQVEQVPEQEVPQVEDSAAADAAFAAGFAEARGEEPAPEATANVEQKVEEPTHSSEEVKAEGEPAPQGDEQAKGDEPLIAGMTEEQMKQLLLKAGMVDEVREQLERRVEKAFGVIGEVNDRVKKLQERPAGGAPLKLNAESFKRTGSQYPEMLADLAEDRNETQGSAAPVRGPAGVDPTQVDQIVEQRVSAATEKITREVNYGLVKLQHKDFDEVRNSSDFRLWVANVLPKEEAAQLGSSWDAPFIVEKVSQFKSWREKAQQSKQSRRERLEAAISPTGGSTPKSQPSETDSFLAGFAAVRGGR